MSDIADRVRKIVVEHLNVDAEKVVDKASFIDDLGADSLDQVELVMAFEEEFSVEIPDDAAESIQTFGDAVGLPHQGRRLSRRSPLAAGTAASMELRRVVVTGMGAVTPLGCGVEATWTQYPRQQERRQAHRRLQGR